MAVLDPPQADNGPRGGTVRIGPTPGGWLLVGALVVTALACGLIVTLGSGGSATRRLLPSPRGLDVLPFRAFRDPWTAQPTPRTGFETEVLTTTSQRCLAVRALDSTSQVLATSAAVARQAALKACGATGQHTTDG